MEIPRCIFLSKMQIMTREEFKQIKNNTISEKWQHVILKRKFLTKFEKWKQKNCHDLLRWVNFLGATFLDILHVCRHPLVLDIKQKSLLWRRISGRIEHLSSKAKLYQSNAHWLHTGKLWSYFLRWRHLFHFPSYLLREMSSGIVTRALKQIAQR